MTELLEHNRLEFSLLPFSWLFSRFSGERLIVPRFFACLCISVRPVLKC